MRFKAIWAVVAIAAVVAVVGGVNLWVMSGSPAHAEAAPAGADAKPASGAKGDPVSADSVDLNEAQIKNLRIAPAAEHVFVLQRTAVGSIDFNEDLAVQVFTPYPGRIIKAYAEIGDLVAKGATLFTIDSPDLIQAESTLIAAAGVDELTSNALVRAKQVHDTEGLAQKDLEQAISDRQTAEAALKAARDSVRQFGKSDAEIDAIIARRTIDPALVVPSPIAGRVTARMAQPGLFVQPGNPPAPYSVADTSTVWMLANVAEIDSPLFRVGQPVRVKVMAFPDRDFDGKITNIGASVDPTTHTLVVRSDVRDPKRELRPGMFATYVIRTGDPITAIGVPLPGVVREGDGTMTVWVTSDSHHFTKRTVKIGLQQDGFDAVTEGLQSGESIVTDGAIFLSNMLTATPDS